MCNLFQLKVFTDLHVEYCCNNEIVSEKVESITGKREKSCFSAFHTMCLIGYHQESLNVYDHKILDEFYNGTNRTRMSELSALEFAKIAESNFFLHSSIYKCRPLTTKHGHNIYDNEILDEFNYGSNPTGTSEVI